MKELRDLKLLNEYTVKYPIIEHFVKSGIALRIVQYEAGEILIQMEEKVKNIKFLVDGNIQIYGISKDGNRYPVREIDTFEILGDVEIAGIAESNFMVEAKSTVLCIVIPFHESKERLLNDNIFLRFVIGSLSRKMVKTTITDGCYTTLEERLLDYLLTECKENKITSVDRTVISGYGLSSEQREQQISI